MYVGDRRFNTRLASSLRRFRPSTLSQGGATQILYLYTDSTQCECGLDMLAHEPARQHGDGAVRGYYIHIRREVVQRVGTLRGPWCTCPSSLTLSIDPCPLLPIHLPSPSVRSVPIKLIPASISPVHHSLLCCPSALRSALYTSLVHRSCAVHPPCVHQPCRQPPRRWISIGSE